MPRKQLDYQIEKIEKDLTEMANFVSDQLRNAMNALSKLDEKSSKEVIKKDKIANEFYTEIKERCIQTIALQQPVAKDLRFISISMDVASNLERVGDYAEDIAKNVTYILRKPPKISSRFTKEVMTLLDSSEDGKALILEMGEIVADMVEKSGDVFIHEDEKKAQEVMKMEEKVDEMFGQTFRQLEELSKKDPKRVHFSLNLILIARHLERTADHAVNIVNRTMYAKKGREEFI